MRYIKPSLIGKQVYPIDNSYSYNLITGKPAYLAGYSIDKIEPQLVTIISEPYKMKTCFLKEKEFEFVTVLFEGEPYVVLNCFKDLM